MTARFFNLPQADSDIDEIAEYIARTDPKAGLRFYEKVRETLQNLAEMPGLGSLAEFGSAKHAGLRMLRVDRFKKYIVFYRPIPDGVEVVRVIHGARDYQVIFGD